MKSWNNRLRDVRPGKPAITEATRPSGGKAFGTASNPVKRSRNSSNWARAAGSAANRLSNSIASAGVASPSRTACINCVDSIGFMSVRAEILQQAAKTVPRLEQAGLYRLFVHIEDLADLLVAAFGKVP